MPGPFAVCWDRIERAEVHRHASVAAWKAFLEADPHEPRLYLDDEGNGTLWIEQVKPTPGSIALDLGTVLYQLRAALDAAIYETACLNSGTRPPKDERALAFPICHRASEWAKAGRQIAPLTEQQRAFVDFMQPYHVESDIAPVDLAADPRRALGVLHDWARIDRHRRLHLVSTLARNSAPKLFLPAGVTLEAMRLRRGPFMLDGEQEIAQFRLRGARRGMKVQANPDTPIEIFVDEVPGPCDESDTLTLRLSCMRVAVAHVVNELAASVGCPAREIT